MDNVESEKLTVSRIQQMAHVLCDENFCAHGFSNYTGLREPLGNDNFENTNGSLNQMAAALLISGHPLVKKLISKRCNPGKRFDAKPLADNEVLQGMRILDLGCGRKPCFARCCRALGALAYTSDIIPADDFIYSKETSAQLREQDKKYHICLNLGDYSALEELLQKTGGYLDLVTSARFLPNPFLESRHGFGMSSYNGRTFNDPRNKEDMAMKLLRNGGVYYDEDNDKVMEKSI